MREPRATWLNGSSTSNLKEKPPGRSTNTRAKLLPCSAPTPAKSSATSPPQTSAPSSRLVPKRSRHIARSIFNKWFEWAEFQDKIDRSPMGKVAKVKHPPRRNHDIFKLAEVAQLMALPAPDGQLFTILFGTGLRKAEARRLRRAHIDLERRRLIVHEGKGGKDRVVAPIPEALQAVADLDIIEGLRPEHYLWYTRPGGGDVISRRWPIGDTTFSRWYQTRLEQAQVRYLNPHTTRHTYHELMRMAKLDLEERQVLMGHVKISTTADIYGHSVH